MPTNDAMLAVELQVPQEPHSPVISKAIKQGTGIGGVKSYNSLTGVYTHVVIIPSGDIYVPHS